MVSSHFKNFGRPYSAILTFFWFFGFYLSVSGVSVQFLFRYNMLCRTEPLTKKFFIVLFGCFLSFYAFNSYLFVITYTASEDDISGYGKEILKNYTYFTEGVEYNVGTMVSTSTVYQTHCCY